MTKQFIPRSGIYSMTIPDSWIAEEEDSISSIYEENTGVGAITCSAYVIPETYEFLIEAELMHFISSDIINTTATVLNGKRIEAGLGECSVFTPDGGYRKYFVAFRNGRAVFITYQCAAEDRFAELAVVEEIIRSLEIY